MSTTPTTNESDGRQSSFMGIFFVFMGLGVGSIVKEINKKTSIPYTPMMFLIGAILGSLFIKQFILGTYYSKLG